MEEAHRLNERAKQQMQYNREIQDERDAQLMQYDREIEEERPHREEAERQYREGAKYRMSVEQKADLKTSSRHYGSEGPRIPQSHDPDIRNSESDFQMIRQPRHAIASAHRSSYRPSGLGDVGGGADGGYNPTRAWGAPRGHNSAPGSAPVHFNPYLQDSREPSTAKPKWGFQKVDYGRMEKERVEKEILKELEKEKKMEAVRAREELKDALRMKEKQKSELERAKRNHDSALRLAETGKAPVRVLTEDEKAKRAEKNMAAVAELQRVVNSPNFPGQEALRKAKAETELDELAETELTAFLKQKRKEDKELAKNERKMKEMRDKRLAEGKPGSASETESDSESMEVDLGGETESKCEMVYYTCNNCRWRRLVRNGRRLDRGTFKCSKAHCKCGEVADGDRSSKVPLVEQRAGTRERKQTRLLTMAKGEDRGSKSFDFLPPNHGHGESGMSD